MLLANQILLNLFPRVKFGSVNKKVKDFCFYAALFVRTAYRIQCSFAADD